MFNALCNYLLEKLGLYLDEIVLFIQDEFWILIITLSIRKALIVIGQSKKSIVREPRNRIQNYRNYIFIISQNLSCTIQSMIIYLAIINKSDLGELASHYLVLPQSKYYSFTIINGIKYYLYISNIVLYFSAFFIV